MFTYNELTALLEREPFEPFRLVMSDGGAIEVSSREQVWVARRYAVVGLLDRSTTGKPFDRHAIVSYMHVTRAEMLGAGPPPFTAPPPAGTDLPTPALG